MAIVPLHHGRRAYQSVEHFEGDADDFDVIVVGTGMGGMSCGSALAQCGKRVLLLEQHYVPGGFTHVFGRKGFQWDVGVHAIGEMQPEDTPRRMLDWLCQNNVEMASLGDPYDRFRFPGGFSFELPTSQESYISSLTQNFPDQAEAIESYFREVEAHLRRSRPLFSLRAFAQDLESPSPNLQESLDAWTKTTSQLLDDCGIHGRLRTLLTVHWGYYGSVPDKSSFSMHALTHAHFAKGAYYPVGGSSEIAAAMLGVVLDHGGTVLTRAEVTELITEGNRVLGVITSQGRAFRAANTVSAIGAKNTVNALLPRQWQQSSWAQSIRALESSPPYLCLNLGFEGDIAAAGASAANLWLFETWENDRYFWDVTSTDSEPPVLYCSFPSLKDPQHTPGPRHKHTGECVTFLPWEVFRGWEHTAWGEQTNYRQLKRRLEETLLSALQRAIPEIMQHLTYHEMSTPLTTRHFTRADRGAIYGLAATPDRFACNALRPQTPYAGLYMTGSDITTAGIVGAMSSGVLAAARVDRRVYRELLKATR